MGTFRDVLARPATLPVSDCSSVTVTGICREPHSDDMNPFPRSIECECPCEGFSVERECCCILWGGALLDCCWFKVNFHEHEKVKNAHTKKLSILRLDDSNEGSSPTPRMKTPFFIFSLAESAGVPANVKTHLYTHAYKVRFSFVSGYQLGGGSAWGGGRACNGIFTLSRPGCLEHYKAVHVGEHSVVCHKQC